MRHRLFGCLGLILAAACWAIPAAAQERSLASQVIERTLPNGLKVLMVKRPEAPLIRCILAYRVGAVNEPPGLTGVSHYHEHMMFKGTYSMGVKPGTLQKDLEFDRQIDALAAQIHDPGVFQAFCQTKNETVEFAAQLMLNEIERMRAGDITEQDLAFAKAARMSAFPAMFSDVAGNLRNFASLELEGRPRDYYETYLDRYSRVTLADVKRVARQYLQPDKLIIMVAGNIEECEAGAGRMLPNQGTIDAMAAKFGGRTLDGLAKKYGDGTIHVITLK
jgi:predicted Zn-dependent peptidase